MQQLLFHRESVREPSSDHQDMSSKQIDQMDNKIKGGRRMQLTKLKMENLIGYTESMHSPKPITTINRVYA